uniref:Carboxylic ester hydrolase n=1 Tax=Ixodes scapularis TaxID=6945 RepID=A0A4D5S262_IXOSC
MKVISLRWFVMEVLDTFIALMLSVVLGTAAVQGRFTQSCLQVALSLGEVQGTAVNFEHNGVSYQTAAFLGIPFAEDTGYENRFKKPTATSGWNGVFNATYKRSPCIQRNTTGPNGFFVDASNATEDCLHLNIWVPTGCVDGSQRYPVIFWAYGGTFNTGGNSFDFYDGRFISGFGKMIVVAPNYRVGVFGFLNTDTPDVTGNMALHDMITAHDWVMNHIERFGGDRNNIILAGQSAGSIISSLFMISPLLPSSFYSKAYLMSGSAFTVLPENSEGSAKDNFEIFSNKASCSIETTTESLECLRAKNGTKVLNAELESSLLFTPSYYDDILPVKLTELLQGIEAINKTVLLSSTRSDGAGYFELAFPDVVENNLTFTPALLAQTFPTIFDNIDNDTLYGILELLPGPYNISQDNYMGWKELLGDILFRCPMHFMGEALSEKGANVYMQEIWSKPSFSVFSAEYAGHAEDVFMLFGYSFLYPFLATDEDRDTTLRMIRTLADFAWEGKLPLLEDGSVWPMYSTSAGSQVVQQTDSGYSIEEPRDCELIRFVSSIIEGS